MKNPPEENQLTPGQGLPAPVCSQEWVSLADLVDVIHHPNFYWGALQDHTDCKYLTVRIDTRDNHCLVSDRNGKPVDLATLRKAVETPVIEEMNQNPRLALLPANTYSRNP
jgi:hypothetical protein